MKNKSARTLDEYTNAMFNIRTDETEKNINRYNQSAHRHSFFIAIAMASEYFSEPSKSHHQQTVAPHVQR